MNKWSVPPDWPLSVANENNKNSVSKAKKLVKELPTRGKNRNKKKTADVRNYYNYCAIAGVSRDVRVECANRLLDLAIGFCHPSLSKNSSINLTIELGKNQFKKSGKITNQAYFYHLQAAYGFLRRSQLTIRKAVLQSKTQPNIKLQDLYLKIRKK